MERPTIVIEGKTYEIKKLTGRDWRTLGEFVEAAPSYVEADFIEQHADFIAKFYEGVTKDDILDKMSLEEIMPAWFAVRNYIMNQLSAKIAVIEKNADAGQGK